MAGNDGPTVDLNRLEIKKSQLTHDRQLGVVPGITQSLVLQGLKLAGEGTGSRRQPPRRGESLEPPDRLGELNHLQFPQGRDTDKLSVTHEHAISRVLVCQALH